MAVRAAIANGNFLTAGTWGLVDATSYSNSETATTTLTTAFSGCVSSTFTPGAITIDGIGIKVSNRTGVTGTISVHLEIATVEVPGTLVTINMADLPAITTAGLDGGWAFFKFAAPVLLVGATVYSVAAKTSSAAQCNLYSAATTNISRYLRTTTTGAPAAGDDLIVVGDYTGAGTSVTVTVTMNALAGAITDYGAASTSLVTPSMAIGQGGRLTYGATAATQYYLRQSGHVIVYQNGILNMGTVAAPIPRDSTAVLNFDCGANNDFGLTVRNGGTYVAQGLSRTSGKNIYFCKLNTDEAIASTSLGVDTDTGWLDNDLIVVASTTRTRTDCEQGALNGVAGAATLTVDGFAGAGGGLAVAHSGSSPIQAEIILLTRNVQLFGLSSKEAFVLFDASSIVDIDWAEFSHLGANAVNRKGITANTTSAGALSIQFSSVYFNDASAQSNALVLGGASGSCTYSNNVSWSCGCHVDVGATSGAHTINANIGMLTTNVAGNYIFRLADAGGTFTNNTAVSGQTGGGIAFGEVGGIIGSFTGNTAHSCAGAGVLLNVFVGGTIGTLTTWRNSGVGVQLAAAGGIVNVTLSSLVAFGNTTANVNVAGSMGNVVFTSPLLSGDSTFATTHGISFGSTGIVVWGLVVENGDFGTVAGIKTAHTQDLNFALTAYADVVLVNTKLASAIELTGQSLMLGGRIGSQKHDQVAGAHKTWFREGTLALDTSVVHAGTHSMSLTPNASATSVTKLNSTVFQVAVANGATVTPTVWINKSAAYDGNQPSLVLKKNVALGVNVDTVLATYSAGTGAWNAISGATPAATDDGVFEFFVDCDFGTGGIVYVDSVSAS